MNTSKEVLVHKRCPSSQLARPLEGNSQVRTTPISRMVSHGRFRDLQSCGNNPVPFDDPDWVFELKHDGFRALAVLKGGKVRFVSRTGRQLHGFESLAETIASEVSAESAIVDGEIAVPHQTGRTLLPS